MEKKLKAMISEKRYIHSVGVSETAVKMAELYGADTEKARIAGLLHDCAKGFSLDEAIKKCEELGVKVSDIDKTSTAFLHAPLGAKIAELEFGITDREILDAITYHTVAGENMTVLDKIIYLADMIEPSRDFPEVDVHRRLAFEDLDKAFLYALDRSIVFNVNKGVLLHPDTVLARNDIIKKLQTK